MKSLAEQQESSTKRICLAEGLKVVTGEAAPLVQIYLGRRYMLMFAYSKAGFSALGHKTPVGSQGQRLHEIRHGTVGRGSRVDLRTRRDGASHLDGPLPQWQHSSPSRGHVGCRSAAAGQPGRGASGKATGCAAPGGEGTRLSRCCARLGTAISAGKRTACAVRVKPGRACGGRRPATRPRGKRWGTPRPRG